MSNRFVPALCTAAKSGFNEASMKLLGIETSCDDTAAAVIDGRVILSSVVASQDALHAGYGGIVPELAARRHLETVSEVIVRALSDAGVETAGPGAIAVTCGPGLVGSLLVGMAAACGLGARAGLPVHGVNHLEGHVLSPLLDESAGGFVPPFVSMVVSGGHSAVYLVEEGGRYRELGATRDDSAGEAFDKAAKMLGLGYPGGRKIDELGASGDPAAIRFPRARVRGDRMAMSFSGLKTSLWERLGSGADELPLADLCASFQEAVVDQLLDRALEACRLTGTRRLAVSGGVSANSRLRARTMAEAGGLGIEALFPPMSLCTDNAAMIAFAAAEAISAGRPGLPLQARSRMPLGTRDQGSEA